MKRIIVTVGPSVLGERCSLKDIDRPGNIYRINGAHGAVEEIRKKVKTVRDALPDAELLLDLPGNKVRLGIIPAPIELRMGETFTVSPDLLNFPDFHKHLKIGDTVWANDSVFKFTVDEIKDGDIRFRSDSEGLLISGKGLHVRGVSSGLPFLFERDLRLLDLANELKIDNIGVSFVRTAEDVLLVREKAAPGLRLIPKIETKAAVDNINAILKTAETFLLDRGDLSSDVGIEKIPAYQRFILEKAGFFNRRIFLATQFLKNMETHPIATIAETIDLYNTLKTGVYGIQLSEETAIGKYPAECLRVNDAIQKEIELEEMTS